MTITTDLAAVLSKVERPGDFCTSGVVDIHPPGLEVEGVGPVALPLLPVQAEALVAFADQAPYGRGDQTILDSTVRRTWQIDAGRVRLTSRHWPGILDGIVARVADGLGVSGPVTAELYKLLVYDAGGFFLSHRDTEKAPGMFATLVIVLPSLYQGGELVVQHDGREVRLDLRRDDPAEAAFAAFYADCRHEVHPVTEGWRLTLIYNLCRTGTAPEPPHYDTERARLAALLRQWPEDGPAKLVYPLEHAYTPASLSFAALKGADAARAAVLTAAAEDAGCDLHLALLTIEESGSAEYCGDYRRRRWRGDEDDEDDFEVMEVLDGAQFLSDWQRPDGSAAGLGAVPLEDEEVSPPGTLEDLEPTEQSFHEATGNEGASFERSYRLAALVLWPSDRRLAVINQAGLPATLPYLADLAGRWQAAGAAGSSLWVEAHVLSGLMLRSWPMDGWRSSDTRSDAAAMLDTLTRLGDAERVAAFLAEITAARAYEGEDNAAIVQALAVLPADRAAELLRAVVAGNAATRFAECADLLARAVATRLDLRPAATALLDALPGDPARRAPVRPWERPLAMTPNTAVDVLRALEPIDPALAEVAVATMLAWPQTWGADAVLVPAAVTLSASDRRDTAAASRLCAAAADHLRRRIAEPLAPPADWTRDATLTCTCRHCGELARFLADPARENWSFKAVQADRSHVEGTIRSSNSDLDTSTLRRGSPHTLVCTKTQASYQRRVRQRHDDLKNLARIEGA